MRYFNAAGAYLEGRIGEWHSPETHAIPIAIETALGRRPHFQVLGTDYETRDGSCVRDFVHVLDLADAHTRAIEHLLNNGTGHALNLGTGHGTTVKELLETVHRLGVEISIFNTGRVEGDLPALVADNALAKRTIGGPRHNLDVQIMPRRPTNRPLGQSVVGDQRWRVAFDAARIEYRNLYPQYAERCPAIPLRWCHGQFRGSGHGPSRYSIDVRSHGYAHRQDRERGRSRARRIRRAFHSQFPELESEAGGLVRSRLQWVWREFQANAIRQFFLQGRLPQR